jgi:hypothetical protein
MRTGVTLLMGPARFIESSSSILVMVACGNRAKRHVDFVVHFGFPTELLSRSSTFSEHVVPPSMAIAGEVKARKKCC